MGSFGFFELINTLGVAVPTSHRWPMGDEGKQAMKQGGVAGPPPYPAGFNTLWLAHTQKMGVCGRHGEPGRGV